MIKKKRIIVALIIIIPVIVFLVFIKNYSDNIHIYQPLRVDIFGSNINANSEIKVFSITPINNYKLIKTEDNANWYSFYSFHKDIYFFTDSSLFKTIDSCLITIENSKFLYKLNNSFNKQNYSQNYFFVQDKILFVFPNEIYSKDNVLIKILSIRYWFVFQIAFKFFIIACFIILFLIFKKKISLFVYSIVFGVKTYYLTYKPNVVIKKKMVKTLFNLKRIFTFHLRKILYNQKLTVKSIFIYSFHKLIKLSTKIRNLSLTIAILINKYRQIFIMIFKKKQNVLLLSLSVISLYFIYKLILFVLAYDVNSDSDEGAFFCYTNLQYYYKTLYIPNNTPPFFTLFYPPIYFLVNVFFVKLIGIDVNTFEGIRNAYLTGRCISFFSLLASVYIFYKILKINNLESKFAISGALLFLLFQTHLSATYRPDAFRMLFFMIYLFLIIKYLINDNARLLYLSTVFLLVASLIKQDAVIFFIPSILFLLITKRFKHLIIYSSILFIYLICGIIILLKTSVFSDSIDNIAHEGLSFYFFKYMTLPYLVMITPMLVISTYILIKHSKKIKKLYLFLFLNYIISFVCLLLLTMRAGAAFHYLLLFETITLLLVLYYLFETNFLSRANSKILAICFIYVVFLIFFKNNTVPISLSVLTKAPKNDKELLLKADKAACYIIEKLNNDKKYFFITFDFNLGVFSRGKIIYDEYLYKKFYDKPKFAELLKNIKDKSERRSKYLINYIQNGNIPYIIFKSSSKNDLFVKQEYPYYNLLCQYMGYDIYKFLK